MSSRDSSAGPPGGGARGGGGPSVSPTRAPGDESTVRVRYERTDCAYASQFVINASAEEVIVNFAAGYIQDPGADSAVLPVHTRIALSPAGAARLINTLGKALENLERNRQIADQAGRAGEAGLPKLN